MGKKKPSKQLFAVATPGLEAFTANELAHLTEPTPEHGGVTAHTTLAQALALNLESRTANRILLRVDAFTARSFPALYKSARRTDWSRFLTPDTLLRIDAASHASRLFHTSRVAETLLDAIRDQLPDVQPAPDAASATQSLRVRTVDDRVTLSIDMSGAPLHKRGYRLDTTHAPLRGTIASALLAFASLTPDTPLIDLCCGSGTFPMEAGLLHSNRAPGLHRDMACARWPSTRPELWEKLNRAARSRETPQRAPILGFDINTQALDAARANLQRTAVQADLQHADITHLRGPLLPAPDGLLVANPPWGERLDVAGDADSLPELYHAIGARFAEHPGWRGLLITSRDALARHTSRGAGRGPSETLVFQAGGTRVTAHLWQM